MIHCSRSIHCIGIGGVGVSALAEVLMAMGCRVTGSDREQSFLTGRLESLGAEIQYGHEPALIRGAEIVVYSSAVREDNPERRYAAAHGIPQVRRAEMVGDLMRSAPVSIGIAGTHGKTTTTSLVGHVFNEAGYRPTILVGGIVRSTAATAVVGDGSIVIVEADEYDRSFLAMFPTIAAITSIDRDHLDCYTDIDDIRDAFVHYINRVPFYGTAVVCGDDPQVRAILPRLRVPVVTCGLGDGGDYRANDITCNSRGSTFSVFKEGLSLGEITLPLHGEHNIRNALVALAVACAGGIGFESAARAMAGFGGVRRRFEIVGERGGITVIDDYAHHPAEIAATLAAADTMEFARIVAVFQPHLFTRTRDLMNEFVESLGRARLVVVCAIYKSREEPVEGVSAEAIVEGIRAKGNPEAWYIESRENVAAFLAPRLKTGDAVVIMGAGDIGAVAASVLEAIDYA